MSDPHVIYIHDGMTRYSFMPGEVGYLMGMEIGRLRAEVARLTAEPCRDCECGLAICNTYRPRRKCCPDCDHRQGVSDDDTRYRVAAAIRDAYEADCGRGVAPLTDVHDWFAEAEAAIRAIRPDTEGGAR